MGIGDSITLISCLAGLMVALPALLIFNSLLFSQTTYYAALRLHRGAITPFFVGLIPVIFLGGPVVGLISLGSIFQLLGAIALLALFLWAFTGLAAIGRLVGMRLGSLAGQDENPFFEITVGAVTLSFALAFPLIGWLLLLPFGLVIGLGATILGRRERRRDESRVRIPEPTFDEMVPHHDPA
jgi:hypothetical protein